MANRMTTGVFAVGALLVGGLIGAYLDWHAFLGNPTFTSTAGNRTLNYDVEAFGQASLLVGPSDSIVLTHDGQQDPNILMKFAGDATPCSGNGNNVNSCQVTDAGKKTQKFFVFQCFDQNTNEPYNCPDPGIKQQGTGGNAMKLDFFDAFLVDLECVFGCDLKKVFRASIAPLNPPLTTRPALPVAPQSEGAPKPKANAAAAAPANPNSYAYVFCNGKKLTVQPMNPETPSISVAPGQPFYWVSNDNFGITTITPANLCQTPLTFINDSGVYTASCQVNSAATAGSQFTYQIQDPGCAQLPTISGTVNIVVP